MPTAGPDRLTMRSLSTLVAGGNPWIGSYEQHETWQRMIAVVEAIALGAGATAVWRLHDAMGRSSFVAALAGMVALVLLMVFPLARALGRAAWTRDFRLSLVLRLCLLASVIGALCVALPGWNNLWALPIAIAGGADAVLTCNEIGWTPRPLHWWRRVLLGPLHSCVAVTLCVAVIAAPSSIALATVTTFVSLHVWMLTAALSAEALCELGRQHIGEREQALDEVVRQDRRERAHWLHDDICAELHTLALHLQSRNLEPEDAVHLIEEVDHRLRLRQLDELLESGRARIGEILQPYIRRVHNAGLTITSVPSFEACATLLTPVAARLVTRATAELTANALDSGATEIAYGVAIDDASGRLFLTVSDNGPGFSLSQVPTGGALWALQRDLSDGGLSIGGSPSGGASVTAQISLLAGN